MRYRKTPGNERTTYKLYDDFGEFILEIKPGDYGVTSEKIRQFHALDDHEMYVCSKEIVLTSFEKAIYKKWLAEYIRKKGRTPDEDGYKYPRRQFVYLDDTDEDYDEINNGIQYQISLSAQPTKDESILRLREIVESLPSKWQFIYRKAMLEGYSNVAVAKMLNISEGRIRALRRKIEKKIRSDETLKYYFR